MPCSGVIRRFAQSAGVAPVTKRSGKSYIIVRRQACHDRLANAMYHWGRVAVQHDAQECPNTPPCEAAVSVMGPPYDRSPIASLTLPVPC